MKKASKLYYVFTYMFFLYPPFIWGIALIYDSAYSIDPHVMVLIINLILIVVLGIVFSLLIKKERIEMPNELEKRNLLFGLISNVIVYFYTFQNDLNIQNFVNTYWVLLMVLVVHYLLISKEIKAKELWILLPIFLVIDYSHYFIAGCGWGEWQCPNVTRLREILAVILYIAAAISVYIYYIREMIKYRVMNTMRWITTALATISGVMFLFIMDLSRNLERFLQTILIIFAFLVIVDFIVSIVNKTYRHKMVFYYIRLGVLLLISILFGSSDIFSRATVETDLLAIMVITTYVSLGIIILSVLLGEKEDKLEKVRRFMQFNFEETSNGFEYKMMIESESVGEIEYSYVTYIDEEFTQINTFCKLLPSDSDILNVMLSEFENHFKKNTVIVFEALNLDISLQKRFVELGYIPYQNEESKLMTFVKKR